MDGWDGYAASRRRITKEAMTADFRVLDCVTTPGSPVSTKASFEIRDGLAGLIGG